MESEFRNYSFQIVFLQFRQFGSKKPRFHIRKSCLAPMSDNLHDFQCVPSREMLEFLRKKSRTLQGAEHAYIMGQAYMNNEYDYIIKPDRHT